MELIFFFFLKKGYDIYYHLIHLDHLSNFFFLITVRSGRYLWIEQANSFPKGVINSVFFEF